MNINIGVKGKYFFEVYDSNDTLVHSSNKENLILDGGLLQLLNNFGNSANICIGDGTTPVQPTDTALESDLATVSSTDCNWISSTNTFNSKYRVLPLDNGKYTLSNQFVFTYGTLNGTYSEIGFWISGNGARTNLMSRALLTEPLIIQSDYRLLVKYELYVIPSSTISSGSLVARGVTYNYRIIPNISAVNDVSGIEYNSQYNVYLAPVSGVHFLNRGLTNQATKLNFKLACFWESSDTIFPILPGQNLASSKYIVDNLWTTDIVNNARTYTFTDLYLTQTGTVNNYVRTPANIKAIGLPVVNLTSQPAIPMYIIEFTPALNTSDLKFNGSLSLRFIRL
jgi:hypothetical protein